MSRSSCSMGTSCTWYSESLVRKVHSNAIYQARSFDSSRLRFMLAATHNNGTPTAPSLRLLPSAVAANKARLQGSSCGDGLDQGPGSECLPTILAVKLKRRYSSLSICKSKEDRGVITQPISKYSDSGCCFAVVVVIVAGCIPSDFLGSFGPILHKANSEANTPQSVSSAFLPR
jgi:hypothetical protein